MQCERKPAPCASCFSVVQSTSNESIVSELQNLEVCAERESDIERSVELSVAACIVLIVVTVEAKRYLYYYGGPIVQK